MTAEQFTSEFYKLWFNHRIEFGLASFHESADILIAAFDKEHGIGAAAQALADAAPLADRADAVKAMARVYALGADYAKSVLRPVAREVYLKAALKTASAATEYLACADVATLGAFICKYADPLDAANLWLRLEAGPVVSQTKRKEDL